MEIKELGLELGTWDFIPTRAAHHYHGFENLEDLSFFIRTTDRLSWVERL